jgi:hypothetical protein
MTEMEVTSLLLKLADLGVTGVKVRYEGGGDSGAIEWIYYTTSPCENPHDVDDLVDEWGGDSADLRSLTSELCDDLESFANNRILDDLEDWWNNDGGYGELSICVPSGQYKVNNVIRVTQEFLHEGDLLSKADE